MFIYFSLGAGGATGKMTEQSYVLSELGSDCVIYHSSAINIIK